MSTKTWIDWFVSTPRGKYFVKIDPSYLRDSFNLYDLRRMLGEESSKYKLALDVIRGVAFPPNQRPQDWPVDIDKYAEKLYGLVHARYLQTGTGLKDLYQKFQNGDYERCPRTACQGSVCIPYGEWEEPGIDKVKIFCPCCKEVYEPKPGAFHELDGAYFNHDYVILFMQRYWEISKDMPSIELRLFGFRIEPPEVPIYEEEDLGEEEDYSESA